jgi:hypothetical protein
MIVHAVVPFLIVFAQQSVPADLEKAIQQDQAVAAGVDAGVPQTGAASAGVPEPAPASAVTAGAGPMAEGSARRPGSSLMNPALSAIIDGYFGAYGSSRANFVAAGVPAAGDDPSPDADGFGLQEIELAVTSAVDPYLDGALFLTIPNLNGIEVEEAYLVTTALPLNLQVRAGTFRSQVGRNNTQHLHIQNFTRRPLFTALLFGADGLRGPGLQASVLLPLPWFATVYAEAFSLGAPDEVGGVATFGGAGRGPRHLTYAAALEQFWDLTDNASLLLGMNAATGRLYDCIGVDPCPEGGARASRTVLYGADLTYHWKPENEARTYASVQWTTELFWRSIAGGDTEGAGYTEPLVQVARRWYLGGRFDLVGLPSGALVPRRYGFSGSVTFAPTEFSRLRAYLQEITGPGTPRSTVAFLQTEISLGAHGAHPY